VAFDAAMDKKRPAFAQHRKIDMLSLSRGRHLRSNRRHEVCRFAVEQGKSKKKAGKLTHVWRDSYDKFRPVVSASRNIRPGNSSHLPVCKSFRNRPRKSFAVESRVRPACSLLGREQ
jgi:hypothetical protein